MSTEPVRDAAWRDYAISTALILANLRMAQERLLSAAAEKLEIDVEAGRNVDGDLLLAEPFARLDPDNTLRLTLNGLEQKDKAGDWQRITESNIERFVRAIPDMSWAEAIKVLSTPGGSLKVDALKAEARRRVFDAVDGTTDWISSPDWDDTGDSGLEYSMEEWLAHIEILPEDTPDSVAEAWDAFCDAESERKDPAKTKAAFAAHAREWSARVRLYKEVR